MSPSRKLLLAGGAIVLAIALTRVSSIFYLGYGVKRTMYAGAAAVVFAILWSAGNGVVRSRLGRLALKTVAAMVLVMGVSNVVFLTGTLHYEAAVTFALFGQHDAAHAEMRTYCAEWGESTPIGPLVRANNHGLTEDLRARGYSLLAHYLIRDRRYDEASSRYSEGARIARASGQLRYAALFEQAALDSVGD